MPDADEVSRRMATQSTRNNSGAISSSSSSTSATFRVVASAVTEPTLNMPTTLAQLTKMIASAVATTLTNQQPVKRDLYNFANSGSISNTSVGTEFQNPYGGHIIRRIIHKVPAIYIRKHHQLPMRLSSGVACRTLTLIILSGRPQSSSF